VGVAAADRILTERPVSPKDTAVFSARTGSAVKDLKINIRELPEGPLVVARKLDTGGVKKLLEVSEIELAEGDASAELSLAVSVLGEVSPSATIFVRGQMRGEFCVPCSRCLEAARIKMIEDDLMLTFLPRSAYEKELKDEVELDVEDLDSYAHDGSELDFASLLREHLVLSIPIAPLCDEQCVGIAGETEIASENTKEAWKDKLLQLKQGLKN
jgi:uncharacterized metal-binding protein YceD (DUF177 family)